MSSILKALKKVEMESAVQTGSSMPWSAPSSDSPSSKSGGRRRRIIAGFITMLVVLGLVYWQVDSDDIQSGAEKTVMASAKDPRAKGSPPDDAILKKNESSQKEQRITNPTVKVDSTMVPKSNPKVGPATAMAPESVIKKGVLVDAETKPIAAIKRTPGPDMPVSHSRVPYKKKGDSLASIRGTRQMDEKAADEENPDAGKITEEKKEKTYRSDPRINLQAVVWSPDPESRFVVINNQMVREGGTVDNIVVEKINPDDVLLSEGTDRWYCAFTIR